MGANAQDGNRSGKPTTAKANEVKESLTETKTESDAKPSAASEQKPAGVTPAYRIGEQDLLTITVWREPELSGTVMVLPDGKITMPLVNDVYARGLTPEELQILLTEKLKPFVNQPQVTVAVRDINSRKVFVIGQVGREGAYRINSTTSVLQIIAEAGGLRDYANRKGIYVLRIENGKQVKHAFNYENVIRGKDYKHNIMLEPGDTVVVP